MTSPGWTAADQAELDIIAYDFIDLQMAHNDWCRNCRNREHCQAITEVWDAIETWLTRRRLLSKATYMGLEEVVEQHLERQRARLSDAPSP